MRWNLPRGVLLVLLGLLMANLVQARTAFGFTPFPYDATEQAVRRVQDLMRDNASLYALHFDDGVPWDEIVDGKPLPSKMRKEWDDLAKAAPAGRPVYVGLTPLAKDRKSLGVAPGSSLPWGMKSAALDDDKVKAAYLEYARRAVRQFNPTWLNLGIEAGEMASRDPKRWPQFEALYRHVSGALKREFPQLQIGISFGLQSLRKPEVAQRAKALVEASDYIGLSFYPHASPFGEKFGEPPLRDGEEAWREPLEWLRSYTSKPIALCETGYLTKTVTLNSFKLTMKGDADLQARYVRELAQFAARDNYLFVVWFLAVDYDKLYERLGGNTAANEVNLLWRNIGLWDGEVRPKPALAEWQRAVAGQASGNAPRSRPAPAAEASPPVAAAPLAAAQARSAFEVGFSSDRQRFTTGPGTRMEISDGVALWSYDHRRNDWAWAVRELDNPPPAGTSRMHLRVRSDRPGPIFIQLEEKGGETFFAIVEPTEAWRDVDVDLASLKPDPAKKRDGVLQADRIVKLMLAEPGDRSRPEGRRQVWLSRWTFD